MTALRLCIIANPNSIHTQRWVRYFVERGHDVHLIGEKPLTSAPPQGARFYDLTQQANLRKARYLVWGQAVRAWCARSAPTYCTLTRLRAPAGWAQPQAIIRLLVTSWGSDLLVGARRSTAQRQLARWVLRRADRITCVSQNLAQAALALGAPPERVEVVPWGVDTGIFHPATPGSLPAGPPIVLSIRAMRPLYNPLDIAACDPDGAGAGAGGPFCDSHLQRRQQPVGASSQSDRLAGVAAAVEYVDELPDDRAIAELYRRAAVAVSVPSSDGTPQSVLEAMACGAVPVLSDLPSLREWVDDDREAFLVPVGDSAAIASAIIRLLTEPNLGSRMRAAGSDLICRRGDSQVLMRRCEEIYQQLAGGQQP